MSQLDIDNLDPNLVILGNCLQQVNSGNGRWVW
jgi:hypothetical protein